MVKKLLSEDSIYWIGQNLITEFAPKYLMDTYRRCPNTQN